jgi:hypothetical protein
MVDANGGARTEETRQRAAALRALAQQSRADEPAWRVAAREARGVFGSDRELLLAAHQRWQVTLLARLDDVLERGTGNTHDDVVEAVAGLSRDLPGLAALLDAHADDPVLIRVRERLTAYVDQACPCGRRHPLVGSPAPAARRMRWPARCAVRRAVVAMGEWGRGVVRPASGGQSAHRALCRPALGG